MKGRGEMGKGQTSR